MHTKQGCSGAYAVMTLLLVQRISATVPGGVGTTGAKRCRHQLPLLYAALTILAPIFRLLLPFPPHGLSLCQALSPSFSKAGHFVSCADSFFS